MGSAQGKGVRKGQAPPTRSKISSLNSQQGRRQLRAGGRRKEESGVTKRTQRAQSEHSQRVLMYSNFIILSMMLKLMLYLFQENKSYGVKTICIHPLMLRHRTSPRCVWHNLFSLHADHWTSRGRVEPGERDEARMGRTIQVKIILTQVVLETACNITREK
jgi:hypothetical protein